MKRLPSLGPLQAFVSVARLGSVKAAADALSLTSPALTRRIQSFEQFIGADLFDREHNSVRLNAAGERLLSAVGPHLDSLVAAIDAATHADQPVTLRIAMPSLFAAQRLMPALPSLHARYPKLQIAVNAGANQLGRLDDDLDAVIAIASTVDRRFYSRRLQSSRVIAIGSRQFINGDRAVSSPSDLIGLPVLLHRDMPGAFDAWRDAVGLPNLQPAIVSSFDAGQLILDAAAEGLGVAFMLETHLAASSDERLVQIFPEAAESPYSYWFACTAAALDRPAVRAFHDWLFEQFEEYPPA